MENETLTNLARCLRDMLKAKGRDRAWQGFQDQRDGVPHAKVRNVNARIGYNFAEQLERSPGLEGSTSRSDFDGLIYFWAA